MAARRNQGPLAQGIITMVGFGTVWAVVGVSGLFDAGAARIIGYVVAVLAGLAVLVTSLRAPGGNVRRGRSSANPGRDFARVNIAQAVLILIAVFAFARAGHPVLIAPACCLVVGLHFLPLAKIFGIPLYWTTGLILIAVAVIGVILFAADTSSSAILATVGIAAAVTLWSTSRLLPRYA